MFIEKHVSVKRPESKGTNRMETHWLSSKENVLGAVISKEGHADSLLEHERSHHNRLKKEKVQL